MMRILFSPEGKKLRKVDYYGEGQFHDGRHPVLSRGKLVQRAEKAVDYYGEGQFHDGRHPVFTRGKLVQRAEKSSGLLWGGSIS